MLDQQRRSVRQPSPAPAAVPSQRTTGISSAVAARVRQVLDGSAGSGWKRGISGSGLESLVTTDAKDRHGGRSQRPTGRCTTLAAMKLTKFAHSCVRLDERRPRACHRPGDLRRHRDCPAWRGRRAHNARASPTMPMRPRSEPRRSPIPAGLLGTGLRGRVSSMIWPTGPPVVVTAAGARRWPVSTCARSAVSTP